jgi:hypothetical protein
MVIGVLPVHSITLMLRFNDSPHKKLEPFNNPLHYNSLNDAIPAKAGIQTYRPARLAAPVFALACAGKTAVYGLVHY